MVEYFQASQQSWISRVFDGTFYKTGIKIVAVIPDGPQGLDPHFGLWRFIRVQLQGWKFMLRSPSIVWTRLGCDRYNETRVSNSCLDPTMFISNRFKKMSHIDCNLVYFNLPSDLVFDWQDGFLTELHRLQGKWRTVNLEILDRHCESKVPLHHMHPVDMDIGWASN